MRRHLSIAIGSSLLLIIGAAVWPVFLLDSQADSISTSLTVNNSQPSIVSKFISMGSFGQVDSYPGGTINNLVAGGMRAIYINGVVEDGNGQGDITSVSAKFYRTSLNASCVTSGNDCYSVASCTTDTTGVTAMQKRYNCQIDLQYYADSTSAGGEFPEDSWTALITVTDGSLASTTDATLTKEMQTLLALFIPPNINYGSLDINQATDATNNQHMVITQGGNDVADVEVSSPGALTCTLGQIDSADQKWSLIDVPFADAAAYALTGTSVDTNLNVGYRHGANPNKTLYWNIKVPSNNISGSCTGTTNVTAIAG